VAHLAQLLGSLAAANLGLSCILGQLSRLPRQLTLL